MSNSEVRFKLLFKNPFVHSTVMFRYPVLKMYQLRYRNQRYIEDYVLWREISEVAMIFISDKVLVSHRVHSGSSSQKSSMIQLNERENYSVEILVGLLGISVWEAKGLRSWILGKRVGIYRRIRYLLWYRKLSELILAKEVNKYKMAKFKETRNQFMRNRGWVSCFFTLN